MADKKASKPVVKKAERAPAEKKVSSKVVEAPVGPPVSFQDIPPSTASEYLMSIGTRPQRIAPMVMWAKGKGLSIATFSQWEDLFKTF
jgi:hypothetical protein